MKYVSFSLYGALEVYLCGILENARVAQNLLPDWQVAVFFGKSVPFGTISKLTELGVLCLPENGQESAGAMMWRYQVDKLPAAEAVIFRDADSRITAREVEMIGLWSDSQLSMHIIRDHPWHVMPIMGGMWGLRGADNLRKLGEMVRNADRENYEYGSDQIFLAQTVYPEFSKSALAHDAFYRFDKKTDRPPTRIDGAFVGERIGCGGEPSDADRQSLMLHEKSYPRRLLLRLKESSRRRRLWQL